MRSPLRSTLTLPEAMTKNSLPGVPFSMMRSPVATRVASEVVRGLMGALLGKRRR